MPIMGIICMHNYVYIIYLKSIVWEYQRGNSIGTLFSIYIVLVKCEECFINRLTMLHETSKLNKVQLCNL